MHIHITSLFKSMFTNAWLKTFTKSWWNNSKNIHTYVRNEFFLKSRCDTYLICMVYAVLSQEEKKSF